MLLLSASIAFTALASLGLSVPIHTPSISLESLSARSTCPMIVPSGAAQSIQTISQSWKIGDTVSDSAICTPHSNNTNVGRFTLITSYSDHMDSGYVRVATFDNDCKISGVYEDPVEANPTNACAFPYSISESFISNGPLLVDQIGYVIANNPFFQIQIGDYTGEIGQNGCECQTPATQFPSKTMACTCPFPLDGKAENMY